MKTLAFIAFLIFFVAFFFDSGNAAPSLAQHEEPVFPSEYHITEHIEERADRHRRVTCDLLSVDTPIGAVNHAACAAHCLSMGKGYKGGRCVDGVCNCRK